MATAPGTYQQSGPSSPQAARAVLAEVGNQQRALSVPAALGQNGLRVQAQAPGSGGEAITVEFTVDAANTPLSVDVVDNAITVHLATDGDNNPTSTAAEVRDLLNSDANVSPLVSAAVVYGDGSQVVQALTVTNLAGDVLTATGVADSSAPLPKQHPVSNSYA